LESEVFYGWAEPLKSHIIVLEFYYGGLREYPIKIGEKYSYNFDAATG
jgi:hypothetical protein